MDFLQKLDFMMKKHSLNKRTLSQNSGIPYTTIDGWYKKGYEGMKISTLRILANYFDTVLDFWIQDDITDPNYGKSAFSGPLPAQPKPHQVAKKELPTVSDEEHLDQEIIGRLVQLTPEELEKVDAFVQGLLAAR